MEATPGFEPGDKGFAGPCLTTWPRRLRGVSLVDGKLRVKAWEPPRSSRGLQFPADRPLLKWNLSIRRRPRCSREDQKSRSAGY